MIDPKRDRAMYRQVADLLRAEIAEGKYGPGVPLPSESALMKRHHVARNTVRLAISVLREEGLTVTRHGRGTYVRDPNAESPTLCPASRQPCCHGVLARRTPAPCDDAPP